MVRTAHSSKLSGNGALSSTADMHPLLICYPAQSCAFIWQLQPNTPVQASPLLLSGLHHTVISTRKWRECVAEYFLLLLLTQNRASSMKIYILHTMGHVLGVASCGSVACLLAFAVVRLLLLRPQPGPGVLLLLHSTTVVHVTYCAC
jgi:hypothetical protein